MKNILYTLALIVSFSSFGQSQDYALKGYDSWKAEDYYGAISHCTKAINLDQKDEFAYWIRALSKASIKDYYGAISDQRKAIKYMTEPQTNGKFYYSNIGEWMLTLKDYEGAISYFNEAIVYDPEYADAYLGRGNARALLGSQSEACLDWKKGAYRGNEQAQLNIRKYCN